MGRTKTKTFIQPHKYSCGTASLKNALRVLGIRKSYATISRLSGTKYGISVPRLIKTANRLGLYVEAMEWATLRHLKSALKYEPGHPRAAIVDYLYCDGEPVEETGHYATVAAYSPTSHRIRVFDSYTGQKKSYAWPTFLENWYDYDYKRRGRKLHRKWHNRLMLVLSTDKKNLPGFQSSFATTYTPTL